MKIALVGYGKMGHAIERIAVERGHEIVCKINSGNPEDMDSEAFRSADVAIEFTNPASACANIVKCIENGVPVVSGSTGWLAKMDEVKALCAAKDGAFFYSSNFSIGVNIFFELNKYLAKIMNRFAQYDVTMKEIHHIHKLDHPSGTAITLAEGVLGNLDRKKSWSEKTDCAADELLINHEREGEVPGTHIIEYRSSQDRIEIQHEAFSRDGFALGSVVAAEWMQGKKGFHTMDELMNL